MWGPPSKADERWYKRQAERDNERRQRIELLMADLPRRMKILAFVKTGEMSLDEAKKLIRDGYKPAADGAAKEG